MLTAFDTAMLVHKARSGLRGIFNSNDSQEWILGYRIQCRHAHWRDPAILQTAKEGQSLMRAAMSQFNQSARTHYRKLKLARTIADLAGSEKLNPRIWRKRYNIAQSG